MAMRRRWRSSADRAGDEGDAGDADSGWGRRRGRQVRREVIEGRAMAIVLDDAVRYAADVSDWCER